MPISQGAMRISGTRRPSRSRSSDSWPSDMTPIVARHPIPRSAPNTSANRSVRPLDTRLGSVKPGAQTTKLSVRTSATTLSRSPIACLMPARQLIAGLARRRIALLDRDFGPDPTGKHGRAIGQIRDVPGKDQQASHTVERLHLAIVRTVVGLRPEIRQLDAHLLQLLFDLHGVLSCRSLTRDWSHAQRATIGSDEALVARRPIRSARRGRSTRPIGRCRFGAKVDRCVSW